MRKYRMIAIVLPLAAGGCVTGAAMRVATMPVRGAAKVVDWTTTSPDEADRNRGREIRRAEALERADYGPDRYPDHGPDHGKICTASDEAFSGSTRSMECVDAHVPG